MKDPPGPAWLRRLIGDEAFTRIRKVALLGTTDGIGLRPEELDALADLPGLRSLTLIGTPLDGRHMERIGRMTDLVELTLSGTSITDEDLAPLAGLDELEELDLSDTGIRGPGLVHLARLPRLRYLQLHATGVSDADLPRLMALPRLEGLSVGKRVTDAGAATLGRLKGLDEIDLVNTPVTVQGIAPILKLPGLRSLGLNYTRIFGSEIGWIEANYPQIRVSASF